VPERECFGCRPALFEPPQPLFRLVDGWNVTGRDPPERQHHGLELLEPVAPLLQQLGVRAVVDVGAKLFDRLPDRHVDDDALVFVRPQVGVVARLPLQAPDEAVAAIGERVQVVEARHEAGHHRPVERPLHAADIDLREMNVAH